MTVPVLQRTVWILYFDTVGSHRWFAHSSLVFSKHSELVSAVLDKVGNIDHVCQTGRQVDAVPVICAVLPLVHPVRLDPSASVALRFLPLQADKVATYFCNLWQAWAIRGI